MSKVLSGIKDAIELVGKVYASWAILAAIASALLAALLQLPWWAFVATGVLVLVAIIAIVYAFRRKWMFISMRDAARYAYDELDEGLYAGIADRMNIKQNPEGSLEYMAHVIAGEITVYGTKPPGTKFKAIGQELVKHAAFTEGGARLVPNDKREFAWEDLAVRRSELRKVVKDLKAGDPHLGGEWHTFLGPPAQPRALAALPSAVAEMKQIERDTSASIVGEKSKSETNSTPGPELRQAETKFNILLMKLAESKSGQLYVVHFLSGTSYSADGRDLNASQEDARELAGWAAAVRKAENGGLVNVVHHGKNNDRTYQLTDAGYEAAEALKTLP